MLAQARWFKKSGEGQSDFAEPIGKGNRSLLRPRRDHNVRWVFILLTTLSAVCLDEERHERSSIWDVQTIRLCCCFSCDIEGERSDSFYDQTELHKAKRFCRIFNRTSRCFTWTRATHSPRQLCSSSQQIRTEDSWGFGHWINLERSIQSPVQRHRTLLGHGKIDLQEKHVDSHHY